MKLNRADLEKAKEIFNRERTNPDSFPKCIQSIDAFNYKVGPVLLRHYADTWSVYALTDVVATITYPAIGGFLISSGKAVWVTDYPGPWWGVLRKALAADYKILQALRREDELQREAVVQQARQDLLTAEAIVSDWVAAQ